MAIINVSSKEKTIKSMYQLLPSDNYKIDNFIYYCYYNNKDYQVELGNILDAYNDYFEKYLVDVDVPKRFFYQPAAFAENYYGTPDLDFLVLYYAKMTSLFEFKKDKIKVLPKDRILEINRLMVHYKDEITYSYNYPQEYMENNTIESYLK